MSELNQKFKEKIMRVPFKGFVREDNMGIGYLNLPYIEVKSCQDVMEEYFKIMDFLSSFLTRYATENVLCADDLNLEFINYGKTQLVYVLTVKNEQRFTVLIKQPAVELGVVKREMENLCELNVRDNRVVAPINYFAKDEYELYITPYINQARCVASDGKWGMYVPEPLYRFECFTDKQVMIITSCMIAKLVSLYDFQKQEGISACKLGGGDFMLPKGWETEELTVSNTLESLYLIAARDKIKCAFEDYLQIIRDEFSKVTINTCQEELLLNLRARVAMSREAIEQGITLGKSIIGYNH